MELAYVPLSAIFGDEAARVLGHRSLGLSPSAGLALAATHTSNRFPNRRNIPGKNRLIQ